MDHSGRPPYRRGVRFHRKAEQPPPSDTAAPEASDYSSRLHDLTPLQEDDGRPSGEDRHTYDLMPESYVEPVERPGWLKPHRRGPKGTEPEAEPDQPD